MREIKFRAWDKSKRRMWWNVQDAYDTLGNHDTEDYRGKKEQEFYPSSFGHALGDLNLIVMQYTGLNDKNGKEIYEGDVVEWDHIANDGDKRWHSPVTLGNIPHEEEGTDQWGWIASDCFIDSQCIVIGNVHENPELLEVL